MATSKLMHNKRGTSLIEVLVVMVILAVGIMTIVQMFPPGFRIVKIAESESIATKLAESELERWKNMSANLPDGILAISDSGNFLNSQNPGPPFTDWVLDANGNVVDKGNVFNIRQIWGETTTIPVGSYFDTGGGTFYGARYNLAFSPIDYVNSTDIKIKSRDLGRETGDHTTVPPTMQPGEYAIDYGSQGSPTLWVAFPQQSVAASYYISYSYWASKGGGTDTVLVSVIDQPVPSPPSKTPADTVPANYGDWIPVTVDTSGAPVGYTFTQVADQTDSCARAFTLLPAGTGWTAGNPYEYALADAFLGVIAFNPAGHGSMEASGQGIKPILARINYKILDPRIMREDKVIVPPSDAISPAPQTIPVKLALRFILNIGDRTDNPSEQAKGYEGVCPLLGHTEPLVIIDLATGLQVEVATPGATNGYAPLSASSIDFVGGVVNIPTNAALVNSDGSPPDGASQNVSMAGRHLRFFYRADGDWSVQCQKAFSLYQNDYQNTTPALYSNLDYRHYAQEDGNPARLVFAPCETLKTVSVDYTYLDATGVEYKVAGESHKISDSTDAMGYYIDLRLPAGATVGRIYAVVGTSFKVRVVWRDAKQWRHIDVDTSLTRTGQ